MIENCIHCGTKVNKEDKFCDNCGLEIKKLSKEQEEELRKEKLEQEKQRKLRNKKIIKIVVIILIIAGAIAGALFIPTRQVGYVVSVPYETQEAYQTTEPYQVQTPYEAQEAYTCYQTRTVSQELSKTDCDSDPECSCIERTWFGLGETCIRCNCNVQRDVPETCYKKVIKYQTETKYRPVTKYQTVTKYKDETRYKKVNWIFGYDV